MADRLGTTARALRHYESIGLLRPCRATGDRRYDQAESERALLIMGLRRLGMPLHEIRSVLHRSLSGRSQREAVTDVVAKLIEAKQAEQQDAKTFLASLQD